MFARIKQWARRLKRDAHAIYFAAGDPLTPWYAKILAIAVAAYALSPIDLIPDFIPVVGYLDDLLIVPAGIWLVIALIPDQVMRECREKASEAAQRPTSKAGMFAIIAIWIAGAVLLAWAAHAWWWRQ